VNAETEEFLLSLRERMAVAVGAIGNEVVSLTQESISEWCPEYHTGEGGHSPRGGPPYLESGDLFNGISSDVSETSNSIRLTVRSRRRPGDDGLDVPQWLESEAEGNRPYMRPQLYRLEESFVDDLAARLTGGGESAPF
jgi:hypothetical protein